MNQPVPHIPGPYQLHSDGSFTTADGKTMVGVVQLHGGRMPERFGTARILTEAPRLYLELRHLVGLLEPLEQAGTLAVPGLATLNGARDVLDSIEADAHVLAHL